MVKRLLNSFHKEISDIHDAAYLLAIFTFTSQVLGLLRDRLLAHSFGASTLLDVYYASFRIPDLIFVSVGSLVSASVLIPFLQQKEDKNKKYFIDSIFSCFFILIILVSVVVFFFIEPLTRLFFGSLGEIYVKEIVTLSRVLLLSPIFLGISNLFSSITQSKKRFLLYSLCPLIYNISIILSIWYLYPIFGLTGIVFGVVFGALLHALIQIPFLIKISLVPDIIFPFSFKEVFKVFVVSVPRTITLSVGGISMIFLVSLASKMVEGSISVFNFSYNLQSVPMAIIGISYSMAAFPLLATLYSQGEKKKFVEYISVSVRHIIFLSLPVTALFIVLRAQIVRTVLGSGDFSWNDTRLTAACFALFSISAVAQSLILLFVRAYYASGKTKKPLYVNVFSSLCTIGLGFVFYFIFTKVKFILSFAEYLFKIYNVPGSEIIALPLAFSVGSILNVLIFFFIFEKDFKGFFKCISRTLFESFSASVFTGFGAYIGLNIFDKVFDINTLSGIFLQGLLAGITGIMIGIYVFKILQSKELKEAFVTLQRKIWKAGVITPPQSDL